MRSIKNLSKRIIAVITVIVSTLILSQVFASVFVYYPITVSVSPVSPPVVFLAGSNANKPDLGGSNTITVNIGPNQTSLEITIHPTYQVTYYKNISLVKNVDTKTYYALLKVVSPATSIPAGSKLLIYVYSSGASRSLSGFPTPTPAAGSYLTSVDLTTTGMSGWITLSSGSSVELDLYVYIPEGSLLPSSFTVNILLIYSPVQETPP